MLSFVCGMLVCIIPNINYYKNILLPRITPDAARRVLKRLFLAEVFKILSTTALLGIFLNVKGVSSFPFIYGFFMAQSINWWVLKIMLRLKA